jgi:capsular polysaccharide biosynthesis protein
MIDCYNPYAVEFTRKALLPKADPNFSGPRKFFMQRTSKRRAVENIGEVADFFRSKGWAVVKDVDFTFAQTIKLFSEAEAVCSPQGSNMSNVLFCRPGCVLMNLVPDVHLDGWIDWIAEVCKLNYHFSVVPCGGPDSTKVVIDIEHLEKFFTTAGVAF